MLNRVLGQVNMLQKGLDASWKTNEVIANNIANADTPGFKRSYVDFDSILNEENKKSERISKTQSGKISSDFKVKIIDKSNINSKNINNSKGFSVKQSTNSSIRMDENNVDIDYEMTELSKNAILYDSITYSVSKEIGRIKKVLNEGR